MDDQPDPSPPPRTAPPPILRLVEDPARPACVHHWMLGDPAGGQVSGHCKRCGASRAFSGSPDGTFRFDDFRELTQSSTYFDRSKKSA